MANRFFSFVNKLLPLVGGAVGSFIPAVGTTLGGLAGGGLATAGKFGSQMFGGGRSSAQQQMQQQPYQPQLMNQPGMGGMRSTQLDGGTTMVQNPRFSPTGMSALDQMIQRSLGGMDKLPSAEFGPIRKATESNFYQNTVPGIAERFTGAGAGGQRSSAFEQALGGAGAGMNQNLAAMEQGFNMQNRGQEQNYLMNMLRGGLQQPYDTNFIEPQQSMWGQAAGSLAQGAGTMGTLLLPELFKFLMKQYGSSASLDSGKSDGLTTFTGR